MKTQQTHTECFYDLILHITSTCVRVKIQFLIDPSCMPSHVGPNRTEEILRSFFITIIAIYSERSVMQVLIHPALV